MDSGWAWIVCLGSFIAFLLETGMVKALGLLLPVLQDQFGTNTWVIGLIISLVPGFGAISCIFGGSLSKLLSPRISMMAYGLLSSIGLIVASAAGSIPILILAVLLTGFSLGAEAINIAALPFYFDKFYDLANGLSHAGLSIGLMIIPPLTQLLLDIYGWRGTLLILGGLNSHLVVCGALLRPIELTDTDKSINSLATKNTLSASTELTNKFETIIQLMDLELFINFRFVCLLCISTAGGYHYTGWVIYFVPHCQNLGFLPFDSAFLATMGGVGNLAGAITFPVAAKYLSGKAILYIAALITTLAFAADPVMSMSHSYFGIMGSSFGVNFGFAVTFCCLYKELIDVVDDKKLSNAVSWLFVGYSMGAISSGFLSGWLYERFGNYTTSFLFLSVVSTLSITPWLVSDFKKTITKYHHQDYAMIHNTDTEINE
ncbi:monocarboxylate transporter 13-like [Amphiura filiformis]|uniref:monocarboxylate transporter 13-like n=1 Tax=Amphiura filiformis TaxID=82378 RepID=UPI003B227431